MIRNYLKIAWRNLVKNKIFSVINIAGLATGLSCFLLIAMYVVDELNYDRYNTNADRIYRINSDISFGGSDSHMPYTADMMGQLLKKDNPEVEDYTRIYNSNGSKLIKKGDDFIKEYQVAHVDSTFFNVFTLPAVVGNPKTALNAPNTVVITASTAKKYFGTTAVLGKTLETNDDQHTLYKITAVIKDIPQNSHFHFDFFFSMQNIDYNWGQMLSHNFYTYVLLRKGVNAEAFDKNIEQYIQNYVYPVVMQFLQINSIEAIKNSDDTIEYSLIPLTKIHLYSKRPHELSPSGNIQYVYIFSAVGIFILLLACINFMNLTTARSANRAREVGIRKVLGTGRNQLKLQFLTESFIVVLISLMLAIAIVFLVLPAFNQIAGKAIAFNMLSSPYFITLLILLPFVVGLLAGAYPAFFLSSFKPVDVLKGKLGLGNKNGNLRNALVVFQFFTSIILIIGTIIVYNQLNFIQSKNLGYNKEEVLIINGTYALNQNVDAFKNEILQMKGVTSGTLSGFIPVTASSRSDNIFSKEAVQNAESSLRMQIWKIDYDYLNTFGMKLVKGRNFSPDFGSDSTGIIINEAAAKLLGYENPIGEKIYNTDQAVTTYTVVGVVADFNYDSLHQAVGPLAMKLGSSPSLASFKVQTAQVQNLINQIEEKWKVMAPEIPFSYRFLDESFNDMYANEQRVGKLAIVFSMLAILIAALGLFGLTTFMAEQRTKEIGVRKVLGASIIDLVTLFTKDFLILILVAALIAFPVAWWMMHNWLQDFVYRVNVSWWAFALALGITLFIAIATISYQAVKAALMNPAKSLRTE